MSEKDTISLASSHATISTAGSSSVSGSKLLQYCQKGEWTGAETYLRSLDKGDPEISVASEVRFIFLSSLNKFRSMDKHCWFEYLIMHN